MVGNSTEKQLNLIGKLQTQVSRMAKELGEIATTVDISEDDLRRLSDLQRDILAAEADIARVRQTLRWTDVRLTINDLLSTYSQIKEELRRENIRIDGTFGSSSQEPMRPEFFLVQFGQSVSIEHVRKVYEITKQQGLDAVGFVGDATFGPGRIYIGSYVYEGVRLNSEMERIITEADDVASLIKYIRENEKKL